MFAIDRVSKSFRGKQVLKEVSLRVEKGEALVLIGPSGSGKTTLLRMMNGFVVPDSGDVYFDDTKINYKNRRQLREIRKRIGKVYQQFNLVERATAIENVMMGALGRYDAGVWLFLTTVGIFPKKVKDKALELLDYVGLVEHAYQRVDSLSGGQKQRVAIARALMQEPEVILADEPISNLDPRSSKLILDLLMKINKEKNITLICVLHHLEYITDGFERIVAIKEGNIFFDGRREEFTQEHAEELYETELEYAYAD
ncbi:phosphonate ABC transporter ATP-binding protein [Thermocrinis sp.]